MKKHTLSMNGDGTLNSKNAAAAAHGSGAARGVSFSVSGIGGSAGAIVKSPACTESGG